MAELRLNGEMNLLSTRYRVSSDCACRFKRQKWMVEVLRETSSDIGRIGLTGHERELLMARQAPSPATGCLMFELKAQGEEKGEHTFDKRLTVCNQVKVGRVISKVNGDS